MRKLQVVEDDAMASAREILGEGLLAREASRHRRPSTLSRSAKSWSWSSPSRMAEKPGAQPQCLMCLGVGAAEPMTVIVPTSTGHKEGPRQPDLQDHLAARTSDDQSAPMGLLQGHKHLRGITQWVFPASSSNASLRKGLPHFHK